MRARPLIVLCLALAVIAPALGGCLRTDVGSRSLLDEPGGGGGGDAAPRGHPVTGTVTGEAASIGGLDVSREEAGRVELELLGDPRGVTDHPVLFLKGAAVNDLGEGVLIIVRNGTVHVDGIVAFRADTVALSPDALRFTVKGARGFSSDGVPPGVEERLHDTSFGSDLFFSDNVDVRFPGEATVHAAEMWFASADANLTRLEGPARVSSVESASATVDVTVRQDPRVFALKVEGARGGLAVQNATGSVRLDDQRTITFDTHAAITLSHGSTITLTPGPRVGVDVDGRAFQVYSAGRALVPTTLTLRWHADAVELDVNGTRAVKFTLENPDPHTDAVISSANLTGVPEDAHVKLPGFQSITVQMFETFGDNPVGAMAVAFASPALIFADAFLAIIDAIFGPPKVPQLIEAATAFTSEAAVTKGETPFAVTLTLDGNFETANATLRVA